MPKIKISSPGLICRLADQHAPGGHKHQRKRRSFLPGKSFGHWVDILLRDFKVLGKGARTGFPHDAETRAQALLPRLTEFAHATVQPRVDQHPIADLDRTALQCPPQPPPRRRQPLRMWGGTSLRLSRLLRTKRSRWFSATARVSMRTSSRSNRGPFDIDVLYLLQASLTCDRHGFHRRSPSIPHASAISIGSPLCHLSGRWLMVSGTICVFGQSSHQVSAVIYNVPARRRQIGFQYYAPPGVMSYSIDNTTS